MGVSVATGIELSSKPKANLRRPLVRIAATLAALVMLGTPAHAYFRVINDTPNVIQIAVGYITSQGWVTEGWFRIPARGDQYLTNQLAARYYYVHVVNEYGSEWPGDHFFCVDEKSFKVEHGPRYNDKDAEFCGRNGHRRAQFTEIDTGEQKFWNLRVEEVPTTTSVKGR